MTTVLIENAAEIVSLSPLAQTKKSIDICDSDLGLLSHGWLLIENQTIKSIGSGSYTGPTPDQRIDVSGCLIFPGMIDAHTHPLFAGSRAKDFALRADGFSYQEIAKQGGGILSTMRETRKASYAELNVILKAYLNRRLSQGVTSLEMKSGYGLSVSEELRHLEILHAARSHTLQTLAVTCLALHAASPEHASLESYCEAVAKELLPEIQRRKLAEWVDAFIETGYFSVQQAETVIATAKDLGLGVRIHADEFSDAGAAQAAARWRAQSADHLQQASEQGIDAMAQSGTIATLLPGTSLYTRIPFTSGRRLIDRGVPVAIATDFNPGSCYLDNLAMMASLSAVQSGLRAAEAIAAVTWVAATALNLHHRKGALSPGYDADFLIYNLENCYQWLSDFGRTAPAEVWICGQKVQDNRLS